MIAATPKTGAVFLPPLQKQVGQLGQLGHLPKAARLREIACPVYAFVTGTQLGQVGHFGIRMYQDGAPLASIRRDSMKGKANERD